MQVANKKDNGNQELKKYGDHFFLKERSKTLASTVADQEAGPGPPLYF